MQNQSFYPSSWDFDSTWKIDSNYNNSFPILQWFPRLPYITTATAFNISDTRAYLGGNVTSENGAAVTAKGVCWSLSPNPSLEDFILEGGSGSGGYISVLSGLSENTEYFYKSYATNKAGTSYGEEYSFTTLDNGSGYCIEFDGEDDYGVLPFAMNPAEGDFTIELWFQADNLDGSQVLVQQIGTNGRSVIYLENNDLKSYLGGSAFSASTIFEADEWYHAALTYDGLDLRFYINGILTNTSTRSMESSNDVFKLGTSKTNSSFFDGKIDEVRFWNSARSESDILSKMHTEPLQGEESLFAYYQCNA